MIKSIMAIVVLTIVGAMQLTVMAIGGKASAARNRRDSAYARDPEAATMFGSSKAWSPKWRGPVAWDSASFERTAQTVLRRGRQRAVALWGARGAATKKGKLRTNTAAHRANRQVKPGVKAERTAAVKGSGEKTGDIAAGREEAHAAASGAK